jgi:hypothetical protein
MAGQGKDSKEKKGAKDDVGALVRRLADDVAALRAEVAAVQAQSSVPAAVSNAARPTPKATGTLAEFLETLDTEPHRVRLLRTDDATVAQLGYALSSAPKIALVRHLLTDGEQSAAQLGEKANLTTGSLYHHLRELIHADVVTQSNRTRYGLTPHGRRAILLLFALAGGE